MKVSFKKLKEQFAIALSVAAFALSLASFYVTALRVVDDVRVVVGTMPFLDPDFDKKQFTLRELDSRFIFINTGTRSAVITGITLKVAQPETSEDLPDAGCSMSLIQIFRYNTEPFVLKVGDMLAKDMVVTGIKSLPFSEPNKKNKKAKFRLCVDVAFTTPSVEYNIVTVNEFEDE